MIKQTKKINHY